MKLYSFAVTSGKEFPLAVDVFASTEEEAKEHINKVYGGGSFLKEAETSFDDGIYHHINTFKIGDKSVIQRFMRCG